MNKDQRIWSHRLNHDWLENFFRNCFADLFTIWEKVLAKAQEKCEKSQKENFQTQENFLFPRWFFFAFHQTHTAETERLARKRKKRMRKSVEENFSFRIFLSFSSTRGFPIDIFGHALLLSLATSLAGNRKPKKNRWEKRADGTRFRRRNVSECRPITSLWSHYDRKRWLRLCEKRTLMSPMQCWCFD